MVCSSCGNDNPAGRRFCGLCGQALLQQTGNPVFTQPDGAGAQTDFGSYTNGNIGISPPMNIAVKKYKALRTIAILYKALAVIIGLMFCVGAFITFVAAVSAQGGGRNELNSILGGFGILGAFFTFVYGAILFIFFYGLGEFIFVFIDIEENTRITNEMLRAKPGR